jgi:alginate O-acetyltransferase complex protein AlgI
MPFAELSTGHAWLGIVCYTLQIYFDFSGYSDMAIGLGRMFGFRFPENFRWPYIADSVQEFWRRWHISLSTWFRDYLYIPLGGNRVSAGRRYRNLVTVFFLCGLWHGASWNFVIWGLWHGTFLVIERVTLNRRARGARRDTSGSASSASSGVKSGVPFWPLSAHVYTMLVVIIGWVFFRAETLPGSIAFLKAMAGFSAAAPTPYTVQWYLTPELWLALAAGVIGSTPWVPSLARRLSRAEPPQLDWPVSLLSTTTLVALLVASIMSMAARTYNPFIYFRF